MPDVSTGWGKSSGWSETPTSNPARERTHRRALVTRLRLDPNAPFADVPFPNGGWWVCRFL